MIVFILIQAHQVVDVFGKLADAQTGGDNDTVWTKLVGGGTDQPGDIWTGKNEYHCYVIECFEVK